MPPIPSKRLLKKIDSSVDYFMSPDIIHRYKSISDNLSNLFLGHPKLKPYLHSIKSRVKEPSHLKDKLIRKALLCKMNGVEFDIDQNNLLERIDDLAGVRILHLHTQQIKDMNEIISEILDEQRYSILEGPIANTWDREYEGYFKSVGIETVGRDSMYTSVHYIINSNNKFNTKCELQVRTLMEEVWGEVSHQINYPTETDSIACQEQIKVLARLTSGCTRLVDSIFQSYQESLKNH